MPRIRHPYPQSPAVKALSINTLPCYSKGQVCFSILVGFSRMGSATNLSIGDCSRVSCRTKLMSPPSRKAAYLGGVFNFIHRLFPTAQLSGVSGAPTLTPQAPQNARLMTALHSVAVLLSAACGCSLL